MLRKLFEYLKMVDMIVDSTCSVMFFCHLIILLTMWLIGIIIQELNPFEKESEVLHSSCIQSRNMFRGSVQ